MNERFNIDVSYHDPLDPRDDFPEDKPSPSEYEDDLVERVAEALFDYDARARPELVPWRQQAEWNQDVYLQKARIAIAVMEKDAMEKDR